LEFYTFAHEGFNAAATPTQRGITRSPSGTGGTGTPPLHQEVHHARRADVDISPYDHPSPQVTTPPQRGIMQAFLVFHPAPTGSKFGHPSP